MQKICLVAVDIRSSHNIGSLFRTADGFSAEIVLTGICPRPIGEKNDDRLPHVSQKANEAIHKTALGAESQVSWEYYASTRDAIRSLKERGFSIAAIEQHPSSISINDIKMDSPIALVVGPEVTGLSEEILNLCDLIYEIPMLGTKESFNVSVAAGIALYQARIKSK